ncbi:TetR/AcrR family transcriptional regulator [Paenibacillus nanensis]|uniref:TetR/AcrR family transcriptional regulator n=1 Tax=Paenibacillus nanensis TaxID=393251 RepID=A0A3A1V682_9BACL|nr:TetR/AcrR family transcriptional regulator [Paenibacillus nanensis]RIX53020.1 TetR/AcrR family transcriptional regulator [Paenibacillus nanensis]
MTAEKIREVALSHFTRNGYEGASLADISAEVGIKKQSIYNYFKGKDELFLAVFKDAAAREMQFIEQYVKSSSALPLDKTLFGFLNEYRKRYEREDDTRFFLRIAFFPPAHLEKEIVDFSNAYIDRTEFLLVPLFEAAKNNGQMHPDVSTQRASAAFSAVLDGMFVEMLYGNMERSLKRLDASWHIYWRGVQNS